MNREGQSCRRDWESAAICVGLSLLLHAGLALALDWLPRRETPPGSQAASTRYSRHVQLSRPQPREHREPTQQPPQEMPPEPEAAFAKTSADTPQRRPEQADFIGSHDTTASGAADAPQRRSPDPLPSLTGREPEGEVVTFDQERQDGDLAHEGKAGAHPPVPPTPAPAEPVPALPEQAVAQGRPEGLPEKGEPQAEGSEPAEASATASAARKPEAATDGEGLKLGELRTEEALTLAHSLPPPAPLGQPDGTAGAPEPTPLPARSARPHAIVYDPTLAADAQQPGLRTHERRTRSTGRFVFGRRPALNVAATARGRYEAEIYRRIARMWYAACDEHRGDIIPGSITVSLRLTKSGRIDSMNLVRRSGASLSQQSFSFAAIRHAALPPMPGEVQQSVIGKLYELILTFNFD